MNSKLRSGSDKTMAAAPSFLSFPDEIEQLAVMKKKLDAAVLAASDKVEKIDKDYMDSKRYMADYRGGRLTRMKCFKTNLH